MEQIRVGVVGAGYWGPNLIRTFGSLPDCQIGAVCDQRPGRLQYIHERFPEVRLTDRYEDLLGDPSIDAIAVATPAPSHRTLAEAALRAGKHVLVEKPLSLTATDAEALVELAAREGRTLATGHVYVYHPAVVWLRDAVRRGAFGSLCYAESSFVNLGPPADYAGRGGVNVIWDLAVHYVSIVLSLVQGEPEEVVAEGRRYVHPSFTDVAFFTLRFAGGFLAQHHVSWLSPTKIRRFFLAGTDASAVFDETRAEGKLVISDRGEDSRSGAGDNDATDLFYRPGEVQTPTLPDVMPLTAECRQFLEAIRTGRPPEADGRAGLAVVRVLEAAVQSVAEGGRVVRLSPSKQAASPSARPA